MATTVSVVTIGNAPHSMLQAAFTTYSALGSAYYDNQAGRDAVVHVTVHQQPTGTTPTLDVKAQDSADGVNFSDIPSGAVAQFTGGTQSDTKRFTLAAPVGRYVRFLAIIGGTGSPAYTATTRMTLSG